MKILLPMFVCLKISRKKWGWPSLWIPVILLWPLVFFFLLLAFLLGLLAVAIFDTRSVKSFLRLSAGVYVALCELRGTKIDVETTEHHIFVAVH